MLADSGVAVIWVSHDTDQLRRLADHVIVLADGAVRAVGHLSELDASADPTNLERPPVEPREKPCEPEE